MMDMRIDMHVHSNYSPDGLHSVERMAAVAKKKGFDGIGICDHDMLTPKRNVDGIALFFGEEVSCAEGHVCVFGIGKGIEKGIRAAELVDKVHDEGGVAIPAHPLSIFKKGLGPLAFRIGADALEKYNGSDYISNMRMIASGVNGVGGSDAHSIYEIGSAYTVFECAPNEADILEEVRKGTFKPVWRPNPVSITARHIEKAMRRVRGKANV
jgi:hypothetical protein